MKKEFVTYEIALKLKELGFDEECLGFWYVSQINNSCIELRYGMCIFKSTSIELSKYPKNVLAPLYQQVVDWFREKHNIHIEIELTDNTMQFYYQYCIVDSKNRECHDEDMIDQATRIYNYNERFNTYEEAREQAILKTIELCQKEK